MRSWFWKLWLRINSVPTVLLLQAKNKTHLLIPAFSRWAGPKSLCFSFPLHCFIPSSCLPPVFAVEAGLFKDGDGDQHSPHRPVAHHWRHAEWLWGIQPEVWLWGRPRLFPWLDTPQLPAEGQGQRVYINTHMLRSNNLYLLPPAKQKPVFFCYRGDRRRRVALGPCRESADRGKLLLALVGPESHDFNLQAVTVVTSGKRTFDAVADSGALSATERGSTHPKPHPPSSFPFHHTSLFGCSRCCSECDHRGAFVQSHKTVKVLNKSAFW